MVVYCGRSFEELAAGSPILAVTSPALVHLLLRRGLEGNELANSMLNNNLLGTMDAVYANPVHGILTGMVTEMGGVNEVGLHLLNVDLHPELLYQTEKRILEARGEPLQTHAGMPAVPLHLDEESPLKLCGMLYDVDPQQFQSEHPWYDRIGLDGGEIMRLLEGLGEECILGELQTWTEADYHRLFQQTPGLKEATDAALDPPASYEEARRLIVDAVRHRRTMKPAPRFYLVFPDTPSIRLLLRELLDRFVAGMEADHSARQREYASYM